MFGSRPSTPKPIEIAQLRETETTGGGTAIAMLVVGGIVMLLAALGESSAVRLAAWGAIWTGWNVIWGTAMLMQRKSIYIVTRQPRDSETTD